MSTYASTLANLGILLSVSILSTACVTQVEEKDEGIPSAEATAQEGEALQKATQASTAGVQEITCVGTGGAVYSPGLTLSPQMVTINKSALYAPCGSLSAPAITSGSFDTTKTTTDSCLSALEASAGKEVIKWNTGETSTFEFTSQLNDAAGQTEVMNTGSITAGKFYGATAVETVTFVSINVAQCLSPNGLTQRGGAFTLVITRL